MKFFNLDVILLSLCDIFYLNVDFDQINNEEIIITFASDRKKLIASWPSWTELNMILKAHVLQQF